MSRYQRLNILDMWPFLVSLGFEETDYPVANEICYFRKGSDNVDLWIFTSIDKDTGWSRAKGTDAIRLVCKRRDRIIHVRKFLRLPSWRTNLASGIRPWI